MIPTHSHLHAYNTFTFDKLHTFNFIRHMYKDTITNTQESWYIQKIHQNPNDTHFYSHNKVNSIKMIKQLTYKQSKTKQKGKTSTRQVCIPKIFPPISSHTQLVHTIIAPRPLLHYVFKWILINLKTCWKQKIETKFQHFKPRPFKVGLIIDMFKFH